MPGLASLFQWVLLHQGDAADPELIHWLKDRMDEILGVGPWVMVGTMGAIVIAIPAGIGLFYLYQQRRDGTPLA
jgi:hypothetical protein